MHEQFTQKYNNKSMQDKISFLQDKLPKAVLKPLTPEATEASPQDLIDHGYIVIETLPYKIGRESRVVKINGRLEREERVKKGDVVPSNDLYLVDSGHRLNISREHFLIEKRDQQYFLVDRSSACGTKVGGESVGGDDVGGSIRLRDGDVISVGAAGTPYVYQFITFDDFRVVKKDE